MLLECAFEAAENAGIPLDKLAGTNTGVFSSQEEAEYGQQMIEDLPYVNCTIPPLPFSQPFSLSLTDSL